MPQVLNIAEFLKLSEQYTVMDVRTPAEFEKGNIPGAFNLPLFSNDERVVVGTIYKQQGKQPAILKGLEFVGPKMTSLINEASIKAKENTVLLHCWRGGMRSGSVAWLLEMYGFKVYTLKGGYKAFRNWTLTSFNDTFNFILLGGRTGSGKTTILKHLQNKKEHIIDLEGLAHHKGSSFGSLGEEKQPTQEQFENKLAIELSRIGTTQKIWLEDESRLIGDKIIPLGIWTQMRNTRMLYINVPFEERVKQLMIDYGKFDKEALKLSINKIAKRLGPEQSKNALLAIDAGDIKMACELCLQYYDKAYDHGCSQRDQIFVKRIECESINADMIADKLIQEIL